LFARELWRLLKRRRWTPATLAAEMSDRGKRTSRQVAAQWASGKSVPEGENYALICEIFGEAIPTSQQALERPKTGPSSPGDERRALVESDVQGEYPPKRHRPKDPGTPMARKKRADEIAEAVRRTIQLNELGGEYGRWALMYWLQRIANKMVLAKEDPAPLVSVLVRLQQKSL
jgi:hypothetical protein